MVHVCWYQTRTMLPLAQSHGSRTGVAGASHPLYPFPPTSPTHDYTDQEEVDNEDAADGGRKPRHKLLSERGGRRRCPSDSGLYQTHLKDGVAELSEEGLLPKGLAVGHHAVERKDARQAPRDAKGLHDGDDLQEEAEDGLRVLGSASATPERQVRLAERVEVDCPRADAQVDHRNLARHRRTVHEVVDRDAEKRPLGKDKRGANRIRDEATKGWRPC